jgi:hypothetical protein
VTSASAPATGFANGFGSPFPFCFPFGFSVCTFHVPSLWFLGLGFLYAFAMLFGPRFSIYFRLAFRVSVFYILSLCFSGLGFLHTFAMLLGSRFSIYFRYEKRAPLVLGDHRSFSLVFARKTCLSFSFRFPIGFWGSAEKMTVSGFEPPSFGSPPGRLSVTLSPLAFRHALGFPPFAISVVKSLFFSGSV